MFFRLDWEILTQKFILFKMTVILTVMVYMERPKGIITTTLADSLFLGGAVLELLRALDWYPDVLHLNDWQTGLIPAYLKTLTPTSLLTNS